MAWRKIVSQDDIEYFLNETKCMHDSAVVSANYISGVYCDEKKAMHFPYNGTTLLLTVDSQWVDRIEMLFTGVKYCSMMKPTDIWDCTLEFRDDLYGKNRRDTLIVWTDGGRFSPEYEFVIKKFSLNESYTSFVIAEGMKWRYAKEADELDCLDEDYERYT